jgi:hypothetical protein
MIGYSARGDGQGFGKFQGLLVEETKWAEINVETCFGTLYPEC